MVANKSGESYIEENGVELVAVAELGESSRTNSLDKKPTAEYNTETIVGIIGNGDYGRALASRCMKLGIICHRGTRNPERDADSLVTYADAASKGHVVFLAIHSRCYDEVIPPLKQFLEGKIVVDISNPEIQSDLCNAVSLAKLLPNSYVMKAFNTVSAWAMENDIFGGSRETYVCGDDRNARQILMQLITEMGFTPIDRGHLRAATEIEKIPFRLFPEWQTAWLVTLIVFLIEMFYYWLRYFGAMKGHETESHHKIPFHANKVICWTAIWILSLVFLPGCIAGYIQLIRGTKYRAFPNWLDKWMKIRKQLGLIALMLTWIHATLSFILLAGDYIRRMLNPMPIPGAGGLVLYREFKWTVEVSFMFAVVALITMTVMGITSLPSVSARMTWREWDFVQSKIGYATLAFATAHLVFYVHFVFEEKISEHHWKMVPPNFIMPLLPLLVLLMKLILILPGIHGHLQKIRQGWEREKKPGLSKS